MRVPAVERTAAQRTGPHRTCAVVLAAGKGRRLGADKALIELGGRTLIERVVQACGDGGAAAVIIVRAADAAPLPAPLDAAVITLDPGREMIESVQCGLAAVPEDCDAALVFPVDYALVGADEVRAVLAALGERHAIVLPLHGGRPGHPIGLSSSLFTEVAAETKALREVIAARPERVHVVEVDNPWVRRDIDTQEDLAVATATLRSAAITTLGVMRRHRSRRSFHPTPISDAHLEWLVDSARYASTSSYIQACAVVAVSEPERKAAVARLCGAQTHIDEAPVFLAVCADLHKVATCCERLGLPFRGEPLEALVEALVDAALFGQNLLLAAESEGLGGCMIGAARNHPVDLARLLELPPHVFVAFGLVLGHPADDPPPRGRMPLPAILHRERYDSGAVAAALPVADEQMRAWAQAINARGGYNGRPVNTEKGWTDRMAVRWSGSFGPREQLAEQLRQLGY